MALGVSRMFLANLLMDERPEEAEPIRRLAVESYVRHLGPEHPLTLTVRATHAVDLMNLGRDEAALRLFEQVLEPLAREMGEEHLGVEMHRHAHGELLERRGEPARAAAIFARVLEVRRDHGFDAEHLWMSDSTESLFRALTACVPPCAEELLRAHAALVREQLAGGDPRALRAAPYCATGTTGSRDRWRG